MLSGPRQAWGGFIAAGLNHIARPQFDVALDARHPPLVVAGCAVRIGTTADRRSRAFISDAERAFSAARPGQTIHGDFVFGGRGRSTEWRVKGGRGGWAGAQSYDVPGCRS